MVLALVESGRICQAPRDFAENLDADDQCDPERLATAIVNASGLSASTSS
ncbi:hypothetical protein [Lentzea sp.]|nr:hypothetical protein [Lentzea sp.]HUQ58179.1 hypothetical protein [Lentzea sp.]